MRAAPAPVEYGTVPRLWPESTIAILASGPSLCADDVDACRGRAQVIAIKDAVQLAPWADCLYGAGSDYSKWWQQYGDGLASFAGLRYTLDPTAAPWATVLRNTGPTGLETDPSGLRTGMNSLYQAINLAVHFGARRIVLLGADMQKGPHGPKYFFGNRTGQQHTSPYQAFIEQFPALVKPLAALGITAINASRVSALEAFPKQPIAEALA